MYGFLDGIILGAGFVIGIWAWKMWNSCYGYGCDFEE